MAAPIPDVFEASAFHPAYPNGKAPGAIQVEPGWIRFRAPSHPLQPVDLPFEDLAIRLGGASDRILFFSHPSLPDVSVFTSDQRILKHPLLQSQQAVAAQVGQVASRKRNLRLGTAAIVAVILGLLVGLVLLRGPLVDLVVSLVPAEAEVELGNLVFGQIRATTTLLTEGGVDRQLAELAAPLLAQVPDTGYAFELHLADDPSLNAFALPGGHMVVHSGLILAADSPEEVLGVIAHEIAHVSERHSLHQIVSSVGIFVLVQTVLGDISGIAAVLADGGLRLATLGFSRDAEREADDVGFAYLVASGIDPEGMITMFEKLQAQADEAMGELAEYEEELSFLATHPAIGERIETLEEKLAAASPVDSRPVDFDFEQFRDKIRQVISDTGEEGHPNSQADPLENDSEAPSH